MTPRRLTIRSKDPEFPEPVFTIAGLSRLPEAIVGGSPAKVTMGHRSRLDLSMAEVVAEAARRPPLDATADWRA